MYGQKFKKIYNISEAINKPETAINRTCYEILTTKSSDRIELEKEKTFERTKN